MTPSISSLLYKAMCWYTVQYKSKPQNTVCFISQWSIPTKSASLHINCFMIQPLYNRLLHNMLTRHPVHLWRENFFFWSTELTEQQMLQTDPWVLSVGFSGELILIHLDEWMHFHNQIMVVSIEFMCSVQMEKNRRIKSSWPSFQLKSTAVVLYFWWQTSVNI